MALPYELVGLVFSLLPLKDISRCRMVCSSWALAYRLLPSLGHVDVIPVRLVNFLSLSLFSLPQNNSKNNKLFRRSSREQIK